MTKAARTALLKRVEAAEKQAHAQGLTIERAEQKITADELHMFIDAFGPEPVTWEKCQEKLAHLPEHRVREAYEASYWVQEQFCLSNEMERPPWWESEQ